MVSRASGLQRAGGILLHPTSLPGSPWIGDLGDAAMHWIEWMETTGCSLWQILPLVPTGFANSPYDGLSAFAGNPMLISLERIADPGIEISTPSAPQRAEKVDFNQVERVKLQSIKRAAEALLTSIDADFKRDYAQFCEQNRSWLDDFALFMVIRNGRQGAAWTTWEKPLKRRDPDALRTFGTQNSRPIEREKVMQFLFFRQWQAVRSTANARGITIIGDLPIFVSHDSADVWAHPELFKLDHDGSPIVVAGVPPDYFSPTGQRWGNPQYRWSIMRERGFEWWVERVRSTLSLVDYIRLDHFRGFVQSWEIPGKAETAERGEWVTVPGKELFQTLKEELGELPFIAEDLGMITPDVHQLRDELGLPGMKVLQFGLEGGEGHEFLPDKYKVHCVAYTGTHDNDTAKNWYLTSSTETKVFTQQTLPGAGPIAWRMIEAIWASKAAWVIAPLQDFLDLGSEGRMNLPGTLADNWTWRAPADSLTTELSKRIKTLNERYNR
ncbi:MAG: 4-alpha-glucanotransferase [Anaerolineales bacterium]|nr:4-alpha-glucanotransferase [Anaerolineales bacterium]